MDRLGVTNGFLDNPKVKITLPRSLQKAEGLMRRLGGSKHADNLILAMNRAAETATAEARPVLMEAMQNMSINDATGILTGWRRVCDAIFSRYLSEELSKKFLPIVKNATDQANLTQRDTMNLPARARNLGLCRRNMRTSKITLRKKHLMGSFL